jgi:hypothetical protein
MAKAAAAVTVLVAGCSFVFVEGPPRGHERMPYFDCSTGRALPVVDLLLALGQGLATARAVDASDAEWDESFGGDEPPLSREAAIATYGSLTVLTLASGWYGFSRTTRCRDAKADHLARNGVSQLAQLPPTWPPVPAVPPPAPAPATQPATEPMR